MWTNRGVLHQSDFSFEAQVTDNNTYFYLDLSGDTTGATLDINGYSVPFSSEGYLPPELQGYVGNIVFTVTKNGRNITRNVQTQADPCNGQVPPELTNLAFTRNNGEQFITVSWYSNDDYFELAVNDAPLVWFKPDGVNGSYTLEAHTFTVNVPVEYGITYNIKVTMYGYSGLECFTSQQLVVNVPVPPFYQYEGSRIFLTDFANPQWVRGLSLSWPSPIPLIVGDNVDGLRAEYPSGVSEWQIMAEGKLITMTDGLTLEAALAPLYNGVNVNSWYHPPLCRDVFGDKDGLLAWKFLYLLAGIPVYLGGYNPPVGLISSWVSRGTHGDLWLKLVQGQGTAITPKPTLYTMNDPSGLYRLTTPLDFDALIGYQRLPYSGYVSYQVTKPASGVVPTSLKYAVVSGYGGTALETGVLTSGEYRQITNEVFVVGGMVAPTNQSGDNYITLIEVLWG